MECRSPERPDAREVRLTEPSLGILKIAIIRLEAARETLSELSSTKKVRDLTGRCGALRTVLMGLVSHRGPLLEVAQQARLLESIWAFAQEVDATRAELERKLASGTRRSERPLARFSPSSRPPSEAPKSQ